MLLSLEQVQEFKQLYKQCFDEELTDEEAYKSAMDALTLANVIFEPLTQEDIAHAQMIQDQLGLPFIDERLLGELE